MIHNNLLFHNVTELETRDGFVGRFMQRYPREVRRHLPDRGQLTAQDSVGCEVRFVTDARRMRITFTAVDRDGEIAVYCGDFAHGSYRIAECRTRTINLDAPGQMDSVRPEIFKPCAFSPNVWRFVTSKATMIFNGLDVGDTAVRPPTPQEQPNICMLSYGSSITHATHEGYVHQAARRLGIDALNLGISGNCHCEPTTADFLAGREDWHLATLELGINMRGGFTPEAFADRAGYLIDTISAKHPTKPIFVMSIFPNHITYAIKPDPQTEREILYKQALKDIIAKLNRPNLHFIPGEEILAEFHGLSSDLLHPSAFGHVMMGENLAKRLEPFVAGMR